MVIVGTFLIILGGLIISKMTVLLAATNTRYNMSIYCKAYQTSSDTSTSVYRQCLTTPYYYDVSGDESCLQPLDSTDTAIGSVTEYRICESIAVRWIWCLTLILITPEFFVFLRSLRRICLKNETSPSCVMLIIVSKLETNKSGTNN